MTMRFATSSILTDIEGTTSSITFVKDVLFPYAQTHLASFVARHKNDPEVGLVLEETARLAHLQGANTEQLVAQLQIWLNEDKKITPLKTIQGLIWAQGYFEGLLKGHIYPDVLESLRNWQTKGVKIYVYSSGSIAAQKLIFRHSVVGDLSLFFSGYFDTTSGSKREPSSYTTIAKMIGETPTKILFVSDSEAELEAAKRAGLQTVQLVRSEDSTIPSRQHPVVNLFSEIDPGLI